MELWVRSQDKECLTIVNHLYINDNCEIKQQNDLVLATYKSKERVLEVLDEIQCHLVNINDSRDSYFYVYEMPKE